ncbi:MAG: hypothetical protein AB7T07_02835 [Steroidobacteraceae bacterium]
MIRCRVFAKAPLKLKDIWAIRVRLQLMKRYLGIEVDDALALAEQTEV